MTEVAFWNTPKNRTTNEWLRSGRLMRCAAWSAEPARSARTFGCPAKKGTTLSGTLEGMEVEGRKCTGDHRHGASCGRAADGSYLSARLATYPPALCEYIATRIAWTIQRMHRDGSGPTGWRRSSTATAENDT